MKDKYLEDIREIKDILNRSTRFISLSGLSGVATGITALAGAIVSHLSFFRHQDYLVYHPVQINAKNIVYLLLLAVGTILISVIAAIFFTSNKTKKQNLPVWDIQTKRLVINLLIPLVSGGILCLLMLLKGFVGMLAPLTLLFYGLALVNCSKYTVPEIRTLGILQIILGLVAFQFIAYSILIWALGFGLIQIIYGLVIQRKY